MTPDLHLLGVSGSLRRGSFNTALLRAVPALLPAGVTLTLHDIGDIPIFDADVEAQGLPAAVVRFREAVRAADGVLVSSPEYNNSVPGVLKNAVDWASRGKGQPFAGKPLALMSASNGRMGGVRAQIAWLPVFSTLGAHWMHTAQFYLSYGQRAFAPDGSLADEESRERLLRFVDAFVTWTRASVTV